MILKIRMIAQAKQMLANQAQGSLQRQGHPFQNILIRSWGLSWCSSKDATPHSLARPRIVSTQDQVSIFLRIYNLNSGCPNHFFMTAAFSAVCQKP